ncbi:MAG: hypothetical protein QOG07_223 [Pseudonocardiales bacterium]|nr:hypothetical protein [Pseudonocardiales bacterium]
MTWNSVRPWLGTVIRLVLGVVWLWSGFSKLHDPRAFVQTVRAYDATPEWLSKAIGYGMPVLEVCVGLLLVVGVAVRIAAIVSAALLFVFLIGLVQAAARDIQLDCGCFSGGGVTAGSTHYILDILRDLVLLILAGYLVVWSMTRLSIEEFLGRNDYVEPPSAKRMRSEGGQRKYNAMLASRQKEARDRSLYVNGSLAIVVVLVSIIGIGVQGGRAKIKGALTATNATATNGVIYGKKAAATVDVFEDFMCPACGAFERSAGKTLEADVKANKAQVRYHTIAILDAASNGTNYSTRAANASLCASDVSVDAFVKFHDILFQSDVQPKENTNGLTDGKFLQIAQQAGLATGAQATFTTCVQTEQHKALVEALTENASKRGVTGTPTVLVNGKTVKTDLASVTAAIAAADAKGPAPAPSPTPTPTPSKSGTGTATKSASPSATTSTKG